MTERISLAALLLGIGLASAQQPAGSVKHVMVYYERGMFGGWPANHGMWSWGNEILVGFSKGYYKDLGPTRHHIDPEKPEMHMLARSLDGGETWTIEDPALKGQLITDGGFLHGVSRPDVKVPPLRDFQGSINFTHPDFALAARTSNVDAGVSRFFFSYDRGRNWEGPFRLPDFGAPGTAARTDYIVNGKDDSMLFLTVAKANGQEGRPICVRTTNGGRTWNLVSWIGPEPEGFAVMPSTVRLSKTELLTVVRRREGPRRWQSAYVSMDNGKSWQYLNDPVADLGEGNPPSLIRLRDGRLCLTYGYRAKPFKIGARLSSDDGRTWGQEYVLRDDGANRDIGYPRSIQRPDGKVVVIYYFNDERTGPERYIAATLWDPPAR